jgi:hypothetical protein
MSRAEVVCDVAKVDIASIWLVKTRRATIGR